MDKAAGRIKVYVARKGKDGVMKPPVEDINLSHSVRYLSFTDTMDVSNEVKASGPSGGSHPLLAKVLTLTLTPTLTLTLTLT